MKKFVFALMFFVCGVQLMAAYQYKVEANQGWVTFDSETTLAFDVDRSGKEKNHENFIDRGNGVADFGWYNIETGETGSFSNGLSATFSENDSIGFYVKDNNGQVFTSTKLDKDIKIGDNVIWGKSKIIDGMLGIGGGNMGSNGTKEFYVFKINTANASGQTPSGQPLPGIIATLLLGGGTLAYLKKRKKLLVSK